jgi:hypothetical protein
VTTPAETWLASLARPLRPDELDVKQLLSAYGLAVPHSLRLAPTAPLPARMPSSEMVLKVCSAEILHKTEHQGVVLGLTAGSLPAALARLRERFPGEPLLLEEQIPLRGVECIVGALNDPEFGPVVMPGAGGVLAEIYRDATFRLAPCSEREARRMLDDLRIAPVFSGYRGMDHDGDALARLIAAVSTLVLDLGQRFEQLDLNPVTFCAGRWITLDAKLVLRP